MVTYLIRNAIYEAACSKGMTRNGLQLASLSLSPLLPKCSSALNTTLVSSALPEPRRTVGKAAKIYYQYYVHYVAPFMNLTHSVHNYRAHARKLRHH